MTAADDLLTALEAVLPADAVVTDPDRLGSYRNDQSLGTAAGKPAVVVFPRTTAQVQGVLAAAHARRVPVVPRGAGSGLAGGANALDGCIVLCLERMTEIHRIDAADGYAVVEPGVLNQQLRDAARAHGLWYPPDPASRAFCTIGGNVNTNAGGLCCLKYGVTRDSVLGLELVLADGQVTRIGRRTIKGVAGYDLVSLVVGSEGTLGVVTEIRLRLRPLPPEPTTVVATFADLPAAGRAVQAIMASCTPSMLELMDSTTVRAVEAFQPMGLDVDAAALLIAQSDLPGAAGAHEAGQIEQACLEAGASEAYRSQDVEQADLLLGARRAAIPAVEQLGAWLLDDVSVPRSSFAAAMVQIEQVSRRREVVIATFGHAGDGNLHPMIVYPHADAEAERRAWQAFDDILELVVALGGTVTGEHGVGVLKTGALSRELDPVALALHQAVKDAWDPLGILNPGKAFSFGLPSAGPTRLDVGG